MGWQRPIINLPNLVAEQQQWLSLGLVAIPDTLADEPWKYGPKTGKEILDCLSVNKEGTQYHW
jgi:hypothetical protein